jgi:hypothetical protein
MPEMKTIFYLICAVILLVLIFFWFLHTQWGGMAMIHPILFEIAESIRCRFEMGVCLSIYPNPVKRGDNVYATIRTQIFYNRAKVCLIRNYKYFIGNCTIAEVGREYKCNITFPAPAKSSIYYAFIDAQDNCENDVIPSSEEPKSKDTELGILP